MNTEKKSPKFPVTELPPSQYCEVELDGILYKAGFHSFMKQQITIGSKAYVITHGKRTERYHIPVYDFESLYAVDGSPITAQDIEQLSKFFQYQEDCLKKEKDEWDQELNKL